MVQKLIWTWRGWERNTQKISFNWLQTGTFASGNTGRCFRRMLSCTAVSLQSEGICRTIQSTALLSLRPKHSHISDDPVQGFQLQLVFWWIHALTQRGQRQDMLDSVCRALKVWSPPLSQKALLTWVFKFYYWLCCVMFAPNSNVHVLLSLEIIMPSATQFRGMLCKTCDLHTDRQTDRQTLLYS